MPDTALETKTSSETDTPLCSKCGKNPRADAESTNPWCKECKTEKHREYVAGLKKQNAEQSFARGITADREFLAREFARLGTSNFRGDEIAHIILTCHRPAFAD